jgi:hypothetical protein
MKSQLKSAARKFYGAATGGPVFHRPRGDSYDVLDVAFFKAAMDSAEFYEEEMINAIAYDSHLALLTHALEIAPAEGLALEFGVASGKTINHLASKTGRRVHGFDSFEGLPEAWRTGFPQGAFKQQLPAVPANVSLHKGLFSDTLPQFLIENSGRTALLHIDCDLYSSTVCVLEALTKTINSGTVIVFDEYFNYPGWKLHEHRAWNEFVARTGLTFRFDSFVRGHQQVCVVVT